MPRTPKKPVIAPQSTLTHDLPKKPDTLSPSASAVWDDLLPLAATRKNLIPADVYALTLLCESFATFVTLSKKIQDQGATYDQTNARGGTMSRVRPETKVIADAAKTFIKLAGEFGLSPLARKRIGQPAVDPEITELDRFIAEGER